MWDRGSYKMLIWLPILVCIIPQNWHHCRACAVLHNSSNAADLVTNSRIGTGPDVLPTLMVKFLRSTTGAALLINHPQGGMSWTLTLTLYITYSRKLRHLPFAFCILYKSVRLKKNCVTQFKIRGTWRYSIQ